MVVIDTSVAIDHLRQKTESSIFSKLAKQSADKLAISLITVQELFEGRSTRESKMENTLLELIYSLAVLPYSFEVAKLAGEIARDINHPIDLADAAIAATAVINNAQLLTLNKNDFSGIKNLEILEIS